MTRNWLEISGDDDALRRTGEFWADLRSAANTGRFWADRIKDLRGEPGRRLGLAFENLPLPGAFREAAIATRALIRAKRKVRKPFDEELRLLYWLAAIRSFMLDFAPRLKEPGFNVMESVPGSRIRSLEFEYAQLGYSELSLLNKTDGKWLVEAWGEPHAHTTLNALHRDTWDEYEDRLIAKRGESRSALREEFEALTRSRDQLALPAARVRRGCASVLAIMALTSVVITWWASA